MTIARLALIKVWPYTDQRVLLAAPKPGASPYGQTRLPPQTRHSAGLRDCGGDTPWSANGRHDCPVISPVMLVVMLDIFALIILRPRPGQATALYITR